VRKTDPVKYEERRQEILEAAGRCFARDGFSGTSISDICAEAKMSPGHLYHYFDSKETIFRAIVELRMANANKQFEVIWESDDPIGTFVAGLDNTFRMKHNEDNFPSFDIFAEAGRNPSIAKILRESNLALRSQFAAVLRKGQQSGEIDRGLDPDLAASVLIGIRDLAKGMMVRDAKLSKADARKHLTMLIWRFLRPGNH
jgi:TetR/AcrR family transcriptional regulator, repressor for uid operon